MPGSVLGTGSYSPEETNPTSSCHIAIQSSRMGKLYTAHPNSAPFSEPEAHPSLHAGTLLQCQPGVDGVGEVFTVGELTP